MLAVAAGQVMDRVKSQQDKIPTFEIWSMSPAPAASIRRAK